MNYINTYLTGIFLLAVMIFPATVLGGPNSAPKAPIVFTDAQQESDYQDLAEELRCLVCQNQNLIDSNSELADDLRREVAKLLDQGKNKQQVKDFMVARYGDFVLYNPPVKPSTYLLWVGPFLLLFLGIFIILKKISRRASIVSQEANKEEKADKADSAELSDQEQQRLNDILNSK